MSREEAAALFVHEFLHAIFRTVHQQQKDTGIELDAYYDEKDGVWKVRGDE